MPRRLLVFLFAASVLASLFFGFVWFELGDAVHVVKGWGYWFMLLNGLILIGLLAGNLNRTAVERIRDNSRAYVYPFLFIIGCGLFMQILQPHSFKIMMDEPVLASTALRMHEYKEVMATARAHEINGVFRQLEGYVDKRPFFYPFLVSLVHDATGYRSSNPIFLNGFLSFVFLALLFYTGSQFWPKYGGYCSVGLFVTLPLLVMNVTGGSFELLNMVMILAVFQISVIYLRNPQLGTMNILIFMSLLLVQTRYESALFAFPIACVVGLGWLKRKEIMISWPTVLAPLLLIPFALQRVIFDKSPLSYELRAGSEAAFAFSHIPDNLLAATQFFFNFDTTSYPNSALISIAFIAAILVLLFLIVSRRTVVDLGSSLVFVTGGFSLVILLNFALLMSYHWGQLDDIMATRIALPFILFQVLLCTYVAGRVLINQSARWVAVSIVGCFGIGFTLPSLATNDYLQWVPGHHEATWTQKQSALLRNQNVMIISNVHMVTILERVAAITQNSAKKNKSKLKLHLDLNTYEAIYIIHRMVKDQDSPERLIPATPVYHDFELELVAEQKLGEGRYIRMSQIKDVYFLEGEVYAFEGLTEFPTGEHERLAFIAETLP
jgi:hypothetical protein